MDATMTGMPTGVDGHVPVMLHEVLDALALRPGDDAVDCTFGGGGTTRALLDAVAPTGRVLAIDRDPAAIAAGERMAWAPEHRARLTLIHARYSVLREVVAAAGITPRGVVADLGLSTLQLAASDRGFSFTHPGPLDMRFDPTSRGPTAADLLAELPCAEMERILRVYGEERSARWIADAIVMRRVRKPIRTTTDLAELVARVAPRRSRIHPATRMFQALRIAVNDELGELERGIAAMCDVTAPHGRIGIVSFHSLEDRIVKRHFQAAAARGTWSICTRRPIRPGANEVTENPRSRSAKLRAIERIA